MEIEFTPKIEDSFPLSPDAKQLMEQFRRERETKVLTLFFSDLVGSAELQTDHGNVLAAQMVHSHYGILRAVLAEIDGKEISTSGDSMLVVFAAPSDAVKFALLSQRLMRIEQRKTPLLPAMRCGIHHGQVVLQKDEGDQFDDVYGVQVSLAARIMSLAGPNQVLTSRAVFDDAKVILAHVTLPELGQTRWVIHGSYRFKGIRDAFEVCEIGEADHANFIAPSGSEKAERVETVHGNTRVIRRVVILLSILILTTLLATQVYFRSKTGIDPRTDERHLRLQEINHELESLAGIDDEIPNLDKLAKDYQKARDVIFGSEPSLVRAEAVRVLARLRQYDLEEDEKSIADKADELNNRLILIYPEEVYVAVRELFEAMKGRRDRLLRERNSLNAM